MRNDIDYSLYLVTDRDLMNAPTLESAVEQAVRGGCTLVQLREKTASSREFFQTAQRVRRVTEHYGVPLIINDRVDIALAADADGVHIGRSDLPPGVVRQLMGRNKILGVSASHVAEAAEAAQAGADYIGVGAMFATGTKTDADLTTMEELRQIRRQVDLPIVVIGGINTATIPLFRGSGIDGIAVVSAILAQPDIEGAAGKLRDMFFREVKGGYQMDAVIFDLDGTLIDSMGIWEKIDHDFLAKRGLKVPPDYAREICGLSFRQTAEYTIRRFALPETADALMREWNDMAVYEYAHNIPLKPYVREYLTLLKSKNIRLGIATSLTAVLYEPVLANNGIRAFFDVIVSTDEVERGKEFPDIFLYTAEKLKVPPERCLVFEDILPAIRSAKMAGMRVYGVWDDSSKEHWEEIKRMADGVLYDFQNPPLTLDGMGILI